MKKLLIALFFGSISMVSFASEAVEYMYWYDKSDNVYTKYGSFVGKVDRTVYFGHTEIFDPETAKAFDGLEKIYVKRNGNTFFIHKGKEVHLSKIKISFYI